MIAVVIGAYCKRKKTPEQRLSVYYSVPPPDNQVEDQQDTGCEIPLDNTGYQSLGADRDMPNYQELNKNTEQVISPYATYLQDTTDDSNNTEEQQYPKTGISSYSTYVPDAVEDNPEQEEYHKTGISSYSTYVPDTVEESDNPEEEEYDDTEIIPHDNMEYETVDDKDKPYYLEVY
ncbi:uncharacterized protein [Amphiura filiformis]|uniref:uncharacterized protein n=1 Tax=Amphiura filiformis TaxID=82378 RepID=UPI003B21235C